MHQIIRAHVEAFKNTYSLNIESDKALEKFVNYSIFRNFSLDNISPDDLSYEGDDPGIDGVFFFLEDMYISSVEELEETVKNKKRDIDAVVVFTQAKSSENWSKGEINKFESGVLDFIKPISAYPHGSYIQEKHKLFLEIIKRVDKFKDGKPRVACFFSNTGIKPEAREILAALDTIKSNLEKSGLFREVDVIALDRDRLLKLWTRANGPIEAKFSTLGFVPFPAVDKVAVGYVVIVKAIEFVEKVLSNEEGKLRTRIFDENVRDFIGLDSNINNDIASTIIDSQKQKLFGILNNGITIVAPEVKLNAQDIFLSDYQIVNGCQTSNVLFEKQSALTPDVNIMIKIIKTEQSHLVDDIVRSTNRQTKVEDAQFLATIDVVKNIEHYFLTKEADDEEKLYFERRKNQFRDQAIPNIRIFDIKEIARCVGAMFVERPDYAHRYPIRLAIDLQEKVFKKEYQESIFYTAAYALYRLKLHFGNKRLAQEHRRFQWHILMAVKVFVSGGTSVSLQSKDVRDLCARIERFMADTKGSDFQQLKKLVDRVAGKTPVTRDTLRSLTFVTATRQIATKFHAKAASGPKTTGVRKR